MIDKQSLKEQVYRLINECVGDSDTVIGALRYGAHLPHIYQNLCKELNQPSKNIKLILSHMLGFFPAGFFRDGSFVVIDDTVYEGVEMKNLLATLTGELEIPRDRIRTAALVVHEKSEYAPDCPAEPVYLSDPEYIAWKEELASLVRQDIRPTERDHPLYYFKVGNLGLAEFLSVLESYGHLHPVGKDWDAPVFRASLTIKPSVLKEISQLDGVDADGIFKVRIYWQQTKDGNLITAVPICFPRIYVPTFVQSGGHQLANLLGLKESFFQDMYQAHPEQSRDSMTFYFASRAVSALLLQRLFSQIVPTLKQSGSNIDCLRPEEIDGCVEYVFPKEYVEFYDRIFENLLVIVKEEAEDNALPLSELWEKPERLTPKLSGDPILPDIYEIIAFMTREADPARWDGIRWSPQKDISQGVTYKEFIHEFRDPIFVSAALDELLDSGLMRAKDMPLDPERTCYARVFLSGGEYNAVQVSRISDSWRCEGFDVDPELAQEEAFELWGSY